MVTKKKARFFTVVALPYAVMPLIYKISLLFIQVHFYPF